MWREIVKTVISLLCVERYYTIELFVLPKQDMKSVKSVGTVCLFHGRNSSWSLWALYVCFMKPMGTICLLHEARGHYMFASWSPWALYVCFMVVIHHEACRLVHVPLVYVVWYMHAREISWYFPPNWLIFPSKSGSSGNISNLLLECLSSYGFPGYKHDL